MRTCINRCVITGEIEDVAVFDKLLDKGDTVMKSIDLPIQKGECGRKAYVYSMIRDMDIVERIYDSENEGRMTLICRTGAPITTFLKEATKLYSIDVEYEYIDLDEEFAGMADVKGGRAFNRCFTKGTSNVLYQDLQEKYETYRIEPQEIVPNVIPMEELLRKTPICKW